MTSNDVQPFHCRGCGRIMGWATGQPMARVYCDRLCAEWGPASMGNETRNSMILSLKAMGVPPPRIAHLFGLTNSRVHQILGS